MRQGACCRGLFGDGGIGWRSQFRRALDPRSLSYRQFDAESRSTFRAIPAGDGAMVLLHDAVASAQSQPAALTNRARGVEGIENPVRFGHPRPIIGIFKNNEIFMLAGTEGDCSPRLAHSIERVVRDVQTNLEQLVR